MTTRSTQYSAQELKRYGGKKILLYSGTVIASGNNRILATYPLLNVMQFKEATFFLSVSDLVGTPGTFDVRVETKNPAGAFYSSLSAFDQLVAAGAAQDMKYVQYCLGDILGIAWDMVGFTSATFKVYGIFKIM